MSLLHLDVYFQEHVLLGRWLVASSAAGTFSTPHCSNVQEAMTNTPGQQCSPCFIVLLVALRTESQLIHPSHSRAEYLAGSRQCEVCDVYAKGFITNVRYSGRKWRSRYDSRVQRQKPHHMKRQKEIQFLIFPPL